MFYKIGKSDNSKKRVRGLQTGCPNKLKLIYTAEYPKDIIHTIEKSLHYLLSPYSTSAENEWFQLEDSVIKEIYNLLLTISKIYPFQYTEHNNGEPFYFNKNKNNKSRPEYLAKRKKWHSWKKRAKAVGIPLLPSHRPSREKKNNWQNEIIKREAFLEEGLPPTNNGDNPKILVSRKHYNRQQRGWYKWKKRAEAVNIPLLSSNRPTIPERKFWENSIIMAEKELNINSDRDNAK